MITGVAYLRADDIEVIGGEVESLQQEHRTRFYDELVKRVYEDFMESAVRYVKAPWL